MTSAYEDALRAELAHHETYGKTERVAAVRAELARIGAEPAAESESDDLPPIETAVADVKRPGRPRKEK